MPDAQPANDEDKNNGTDPQEVSADNIPTLDELHDRTVQKIENEPEGGDDDEDSGQGDAGGAGGDADDDTAGDDGGDDDDQGAGSDDDDGAGSGDDNKGDEPTPPAQQQPQGQQPQGPDPGYPPRPQSAPELDTDITKPGDSKIAIKNFEGKTFYFNNLDEVPDDFEPESYKSWGVAVDKFTRKSISEEQDRLVDAQIQEKQAGEAAVADLQKGWDTEVKTLTDSGILPSDTKKREEIVNGVYEYMAKRLNAGVIIDSWSEAYKGYMYERQQQDAADQQKKSTQSKKKRGGLVQPGGNAQQPAGNQGAGGSRIIEGPPPGVSLDQVHEHALNQL